MGGSLTPTNTQPSSQNQEGGITIEQFKQMGGSLPTATVTPKPVTPSVNPATNMLEANQQGVDQAAGGIKDIFDATNQDVQRYDKNGVPLSVGSGADVVGGLKKIGVVATDVVSGGISAAFAPLTGLLSTIGHIPVGNGETIGSRIQKNGIDDIVNRIGISDLKPLQDFMVNNPNADKVIGNLMNIVATVAGGEKAPEIKTAVTEGLDAAGTKVQSIIPPDGGTPPSVPSPTETQIQAVANDWKAPSDINKASYNNARAALAKDPEIPNNIAKAGLNPYTHIEDGLYNTKETAQQIRVDTGKLSGDALRPALQQADYSVARTPVVELKPTPDMSSFLTAGGEESVGVKVKNELEALQRKYPDGMSLTDMLDEKIKYDKNGGYSKFKSDADNISAIANRSIADDLRTKLDEKVPPEIPIREFNAELAKNYRMADYLEALNGKKAPVNVIQMAARLGAKFVGAKLGGVFGGDVVSAFGGYQIGKLVEQFAENLANPLRDTFLKNLQVTNPEAFKAVQKYMDNAEIQRALTPKLSAGTPLGSPENPIIPVQPTTYEAPATESFSTKTNKTGDAYRRNLKTGKVEIYQKPSPRLRDTAKQIQPTITIKKPIDTTIQDVKGKSSKKKK